MHKDDKVRQSQFKKNEHNTPWYATSDINGYWKYLDDLAKNLEARDITTSGNEKFSVTIAQMWESNYFTEESLKKWLNKATGNKTWANVKIYFGELYQDCTQFSRSTTGKRAKFDRANNIK